MLKASLIIPTYNKLSRLKLLMTSLKNQNCSTDCFEVIIINDQSTDDTMQYLKSLKSDFALHILEQKHSGRAETRNKGLMKAKNDVIIFVDDDLILSPDFITEHLKRHETGECVVHGRIANLPYLKFFADPSNGIFYDGLNVEVSKAAPMRQRCITEEDIINDFNAKVVKMSRLTPMEKMISKLLSDYSGKADWIAFNGGNTSADQSLLLKIGGFDEKFGFNWGCEDLELGYRLFKENVRFIYSNEAVNYHIAHYRASFKEEHEKNSNYFYEKHNDEKILLFQAFVESKINVDDFLERL